LKFYLINIHVTEEELASFKEHNNFIYRQVSKQ
jgi:hypothetical protein